MNRIVLLTDALRPENELLAWLHRLFPDCPIDVMSRPGQTLDESHQTDSGEGETRGTGRT